MPVIRISDAAWADLALLKDWFHTSTPGETVEHIIRKMMEVLGIERDIEDDRGDTLALSYTKPIYTCIDGTELHHFNWSNILLDIIRRVNKIGNFAPERLSRELKIPVKVGRYEKLGYRYYQDLGISIQGQSAPDAWREAKRLADKWKIPTLVRFKWRDNPKAARPGAVGEVRAGGYPLAVSGGR